MGTCTANADCDSAIVGEWESFVDAWSPIENEIPYAIVRGNRDNKHACDAVFGTPPRVLAHLPGFSAFYGRAKFQETGTWVDSCDIHTPDARCQDANDTGHVWKFQLGDQDVLVAGLPNKPSAGVRDWFAEKLLADPRFGPEVTVTDEMRPSAVGLLFSVTHLANEMPVEVCTAET